MWRRLAKLCTVRLLAVSSRRAVREEKRIQWVLEMREVRSADSSSVQYARIGQRLRQIRSVRMRTVPVEQLLLAALLLCPQCSRLLCLAHPLDGRVRRLHGLHGLVRLRASCCDWCRGYLSRASGAGAVARAGRTLPVVKRDGIRQNLTDVNAIRAGQARVAVLLAAATLAGTTSFRGTKQQMLIVLSGLALVAACPLPIVALLLATVVIILVHVRRRSVSCGLLLLLLLLLLQALGSRSATSRGDRHGCSLGSNRSGGRSSLGLQHLSMALHQGLHSNGGWRKRNGGGRIGLGVG